MLVRTAMEGDFQEIADKSKEWGDLVIEREFIYHILTSYFRDTCFIAEERGEIIGYLLGFRSQVDPDEMFMHLIQVAPERRGFNVGKKLFDMFQSKAKALGCKKICTMIRPENKYAGYYLKAGFSVVRTENSIEANGYPAVKDYNGPGKHMVMWCKQI